MGRSAGALNVVSLGSQGAWCPAPVSQQDGAAAQEGEGGAFDFLHFAGHSGFLFFLIF